MSASIRQAPAPIDDGYHDGMDGFAWDDHDRCDICQRCTRDCWCMVHPVDEDEEVCPGHPSENNGTPRGHLPWPPISIMPTRAN